MIARRAGPRLWLAHDFVRNGASVDPDIRSEVVMPAAHHIVLRLSEPRAIASTTVQRRILARSLLRIGRAFDLLAFRCQERLDLVALCDARRATELGRRVEISLRRGLRLPVPFLPAHARPIADDWSLAEAIHYVFRRQATRCDPLHDGSNLLDLLGLRMAGRATREALRSVLPEIRYDHLLEHLGGAALAFSLADTRLDDLSDAAAAVWCLPRLVGRSREVQAARLAAAHAARSFASARAIASVLGVGVRTVRELWRRPAPLEEVRAVRLQLALRSYRAAQTMLDRDGRRRCFVGGW
jgi:hypothetical protein